MSDDQQLVLVETNEQHVVLSHEDWYVVSVGEQGPPGPPGPSGTTTASYTASVSLGGHRLVLRTLGGVAYASSDDLTHLGRVIGITTGAAAEGDQISVRSVGEIVEPSWNWDTAKPVYLGTNGLLTQTPPAVGAALFSQIVGFPVSPTTLFIHLRDPVILA